MDKVDNRREAYRLARLERDVTHALNHAKPLTQELEELQAQIIQARDRAASRADLARGYFPGGDR